MDITAITGLPVEGEELLTLFSLLTRDLGIQFSKSSASYLAFLVANAKNKALVSNGKHYSILLYLLCKYFICTNSMAIVYEYSYYVATIVFGRPLVLAPFIFIFTV